MIKHVQHKRKRSDGWSAHAYRDRFGVWPKGLSNEPVEASAEVWSWVKAKDIRFAKKKEKLRRLA